MLEFKEKPGDWEKVDIETMRMVSGIKKAPFGGLHVRINGIVYKRYSKQYRKAMEQEILWAKLNDN